MNVRSNRTIVFELDRNGGLKMDKKVKARSLSSMKELKPKVDFHPDNPHLAKYQRIKKNNIFDVNNIVRFNKTNKS